MKNLITILLLVSISQTAFSQSDSLSFRDSLAAYAQTLSGITYSYGGTSENGFDCSGFVYYVFKHFNKSVPRTSKSYANYGSKTDINNCQPGDIIVFTGTNSSIRKPGHLGIVISNNNGVVDFIHSSSSKRNYGVTVTRFNDSGYVKRFLSVVSVINE
ncbi:MAG: C40 family peptidase [Crocinitomicaceae bacterium]